MASKGLRGFARRFSPLLSAPSPTTGFSNQLFTEHPNVLILSPPCPCHYTLSNSHLSIYNRSFTRTKARTRTPEDDDEDVIEDEQFEEDFFEDAHDPNNLPEYSFRAIRVPQLRVGYLAQTGFGTTYSGSKVQELIDTKKLLFNGMILQKKTQRLSDGDILDLYKSNQDKDGFGVSRIVVKYVDDVIKAKDIYIVYIRLYKGLKILDS